MALCGILIMTVRASPSPSPQDTCIIPALYSSVRLSDGVAHQIDFCCARVGGCVAVDFGEPTSEPAKAADTSSGSVHFSRNYTKCTVHVMCPQHGALPGMGEHDDIVNTDREAAAKHRGTGASAAIGTTQSTHSA